MIIKNNNNKYFTRLLICIMSGNECDGKVRYRRPYFWSRVKLQPREILSYARYRSSSRLENTLKSVVFIERFDFIIDDNNISLYSNHYQNHNIKKSP